MFGLRSAAIPTKSTPKRALLTSSVGKSVRGGRKVRLATEGSHHSVETVGGPLPVLVTETLSQLDNAAAVSVALSPTGWAWLAVGRKLLVWRYKKLGTGKAGMCRELQLPPSALAADAKLACLMESASHQEISCLYSTPDGSLRYWHNISHEASYLDGKADVRGQQAKSVQPLPNGQAILATNQSTLFHVTMTQQVIKCQDLRSLQGGSKGMLSGFSRRMSTFIFGSGTLQQLDEPLKRILTNDEGDILVLSAGHLQKWSVVADSIQFQYQCDLQQLVASQISETFRVSSVTISPIDMQWTRGGILVVVAFVDASAPPTVNFVAAMVNLASDGPPDSCTKMTSLNYSTEQMGDESVSSLCLIPSDVNSQLVYLLSGNTIVCAPLANTASQAVDQLQFLASEQILGICSSGGIAPLLYCLHLGIVCIKGIQLELNLSLLESSMTSWTAKGQDQSILDDSAMTATTDHDGTEAGSTLDKAQQLKASFLLWLRDGQPAGSFVLEQMNIKLGDTAEGISLLSSVVELSRRLIDDISSNDPRWAEDPNTSIQMSKELMLQQQQVQSVLLVNQLEEKNKAHYLYRLFLNSTGIWNKLLSTSRGEDTLAEICQHTDKISAAKALLDASSRCGAILDSAIRIAIGRRGQEIARNLSPQDLFFRQLSKIDDIFDALLSYQENQLAGAVEALYIVKDINDVLLAVVYSVVKGAQDARTTGTYAQDVCGKSTSSSYKLTSLCPVLEKQHAITLAQLPAAEDSQARGFVCQQLADIADAVLADHAELLMAAEDSSPRKAELERLYHDARNRLLQPFLSLDQYERAAALAEKYCNFQLLIEICELTSNEKRLQQYQERYANQGFADVLFNFYMREGKQSKLLRLAASTGQQTEAERATCQLSNRLELFLQRQGYNELSWLHDIGRGQFSEACQALLHLAEKEETYLSKKKTLCSLGKLALLASDFGSDVGDGNSGHILERINHELAVILHQEKLPSYVIRGLGMEAHDMHVLTPIQIIEGYIDGHGVSASEQDFLKALDLLQLLAGDRLAKYSTDELLALRLHIWSRAVLRDDWLALSSSAISSSEVISMLGNTIFMRLIDLLLMRCHDGAGVVKEQLPALQELLSSNELAHLRADTKFCYLLAAAYEQVSKAVGAQACN